MDVEIERYLDRFPTKLKEYLSIEKHKNRLLDSVLFDYEDVKVYRGVHNSDKVRKEDFLSNIEEADYYSLASRPNETLENYAISVNESICVIEAQLKFPNKKKKLVALAEGIMSSKYGPADFDEDRPHHNWYLYEECDNELVSGFKVIKKYE